MLEKQNTYKSFSYLDISDLSYTTFPLPQRAAAFRATFYPPHLQVSMKNSVLMGDNHVLIFNFMFHCQRAEKFTSLSHKATPNAMWATYTSK